MKQQFDIKFAAREYTTATGDKKTYWSQHGTLWIDGEKITIKLDSIPQSANWDGYLKAFPHRPKGEQFNRSPMDDDENIPF